MKDEKSLCASIVMELVSENPKHLSELADIMKVNRSELKGYLLRMEEEGKIKKVITGRTKIYSLKRG